MAPIFPSVDSATLKALRKGDASALERIHRGAYAAILAEATKQTGDAAVGPPAAEIAMVQLWENRGNIESAEEFEQALQAAVRGGITREQRRRAANKETGKTAAGTVDSTWSHIAAEIAKAPAAAGPKHAAPKRSVEKVKADGGRGGMIAIGVLLVIAAAYGAYRVSQSGDHDMAQASYAAADAKTVSVTPGQRGNLPLGPGDTAVIGSDSRITVGADYGTKFRAVKVDGSASLRVSNGVRFEANAKDVSMVTSGGSFAVRAYKDDPGVIVRVKDGEVKVDAGKESRTIAAGRQFRWRRTGRCRSRRRTSSIRRSAGWMARSPLRTFR